MTTGHNIAASDDNAGDATSVGVQAGHTASCRRADTSGDKSDKSAGIPSEVGVTAGHNIAVAASDDNAGDGTRVGVLQAGHTASRRRADTSGNKSDESAGSATNVGVTAGHILAEDEIQKSVEELGDATSIGGQPSYTSSPAKFNKSD